MSGRSFMGTIIDSGESTVETVKTASETNVLEIVSVVCDVVGLIIDIVSS